MNGELSHGLAPLITRGNRILRSDKMQPILLRGVNRSGLEYTRPSQAGFLAAAGFTQDEVRHISQVWGANTIRVPFNQDWALHGVDDATAEDYLSSLDQVISWNSELGSYTILDLQWLDAETVYGHVQQQGKAVDNHVPPLPNADSIRLWRLLASRYKREPAVLFDVLNEPHDPLADDFEPMFLVGDDGELVESRTAYVTADQWVPWAQRLVTEIRALRPDGLILIGGIDWAFDLREIRLHPSDSDLPNTDAPNVVYSAHIYPNRPQSTWHKAFAGADEVPLFVGEWGGTDQDLEFGQTLAQIMRQLGIGWTAWSWADYPRLVAPPGAPDYSPTDFGRLVAAQLKSA